MIQNSFNWLFSHPKKSVILFFILTLLSSLGIFNLSSKFGPEVWYSKDHPLMEKYLFFEKEFGTDGSIIISVHHPDGILNKESIEIVKNLTKKLYLVHDIIQVQSLANFNWVHSEDDTINIEPIFGEHAAKLSDEFILKRSEVVRNHPELPGALISKDSTTTFINGYIKPSFGKSKDFKRIVSETEKLISSFEKNGHKIRLFGSAYLTHTIKETSANDLKVLLPMLLLLIVLTIYLVFKSLQFLLIAFIILISTNILTFGIAGFFGFAFTNISFTIPIILLAICIADTVHMMSTLCTSYHDDTQLKQALYATYFKNLKPTIITSLTTAIGFFSLVSSNTAPIMEMGLVSGLGVLLAWLSTYVLFGPLILLMPTIKFKNTNIISAKVWEKLSQWIIKMRWPITIIFTLLTIASFLLAMQNKMDLNPIDQFASSSKIWKTNQFIQNKIGGLQGPELLIDSGEKDGIKNPLFLQKIELLTQKILQYPFVNKVKSINDFLKQINQTLHNDQKEFYSLPKTQNAVAEALLLLTMDSHQADIINSKVSIDRRYLRLSVLWNIDSSQEGLLATEDIVNKAQSLGLNTYATGKNNLSVNMVNYIFDTFVSSIALSLIFITLVIIISLKSIKIGLFSIIPNILPIILGGAWIYLSGNLLDFSCVVAFVISLGIAVDDTVHFLVAHKDYKNEKNSLILIFKKSGNGIVLTTFILVLGFISLTFSDFLANYKLGFLTVVVLGSALIADLFFLPALISILSKKKPN